MWWTRHVSVRLQWYEQFLCSGPLTRPPHGISLPLWIYPNLSECVYMPTSSTAARCEPPDVYDAAITEIFTDLKDECADFSDFVVDLIDQLDSLRAEIDRKTTELDQDRQSLA